jgi:uncharacterized membrane protein YidH (DUF202 family)
LGFVVAKIAYIIRVDGHQVHDKAFYSATGVLLVLCGGAVIVVGNWQHRNVFRGLHGDDQGTRPQWPQVMTAIAVAISLALATLIVIST